ncbi:MAG: Na+/H+ antiporter subunit E [Chlamydiales bacterium]
MQIRLFCVKHMVPAILLSVIWFFLTGGSLLSWLIGVPAIILGIMARDTLASLSPFRISLSAVPSFLIFFVWQSMLGGVDVAMRTFQRDCRLSPRLMTYSFRMSNQIARIFFSNVVSLLPGTLSADLHSDGVYIHLLDDKLPNLENLQILEAKVAALFGEKILYG